MLLTLRYESYHVYTKIKKKMQVDEKKENTVNNKLS